MPTPRDTEIRNAGFFILPRNVYRPNYAVTIVDADNVTQTVTNDITSITVQRSEIEIVGNYQLTLLNTGGKYTERFQPRSTVTIQFDYESGTTTQLTGRVDSIYYNFNNEGYTMTVSGRQAPQAMDKTTNISFAGTRISDAIAAVVNELNSFYTSAVITQANVTATAITVTATYRNQSYWAIITDLVKRAGQGCYINATNDLVTYTLDSVTNGEESITEGDNLLSCNGYGQDYNIIENRIIVYGKQEEGVIVLATTTDNGSKDSSWIKDAIINDSSIQNTTEAEERAETELNIRKNNTPRGGFTCTGMPTLQPGQKIPTLVPLIGVSEFVKIKEFTHSISMGGFTTSVTVERLQRTLPTLLRMLMKDDEGLRNFENPNNMESSYYVPFNDNTQTASVSSTSIADGYLVLDTSIDTGTWNSTAKVANANIAAVDVRLKGEDLGITTVDVSANNGLDFESVTPGINGNVGAIHVMTNAGNQLILRITLKSNADFLTPRVDSAVVLFR